MTDTISAKQVMELRAATGMGMMECKRALQESEGDFEGAYQILRERGLQKAAGKAGRETGEGLVRVRFSEDHKVGSMVLVLCETEPVVRTPMFREFVDWVADLVQERGIASLDDLGAETWPHDEASSVEAALQTLIAKIGENMRIAGLVRIALGGPGIVGSYVHHDEKQGVLVGLRGEGKDLFDLAKGLGMHIAHHKPIATTREEIPASEVEKERQTLRAQIDNDEKLKGKPPQAIESILDGRLDKLFYAQRVLLEQPYVRDTSGKTTVRDVLEQHGVEIERWVLLRAGA